MDKRLNILIIEPSDIIAEGIEHLISKIQIAKKLYRYNTLLDIDKNKDIENNEWDIVIVNPALINVCTQARKNFHNKFNDSTLIALLTGVYDRNVCDLFQDCIYLNDSIKQINTVLYKCIKNKHKHLTDSSILTEREIEVLRHLVRGNSIKETADNLNISTHTALSHRRNISEKLGIKSVAAMAIYAVAAKIIDPNESLDRLK